MLRLPSGWWRLEMLPFSVQRSWWSTGCCSEHSHRVPYHMSVATQPNGLPLGRPYAPFSASVVSITATATAESLQSCPTLCDPIDGSPPGSSVHGMCLSLAAPFHSLSPSSKPLQQNMYSVLPLDRTPVPSCLNGQWRDESLWVLFPCPGKHGHMISSWQIREFQTGGHNGHPEAS